jgi:hypothetical protein
MKLSEQIELIINIMTQSVADYDWYTQALSDCDAEQNNLLHAFEGILEDRQEVVLPTANEQRRLATKMTHCRSKRRSAKDLLRTHFPLSNYTKSDSGRAFLNAMKNVLGEVRKAEKQIEDRRYYGRDTETAPPNEKLETMIKKVVKSRKKGKKK